MTPLHDHPVIHSASTNRRTARRKWSAALWVKATDSSGYEQWSSGTAGSVLQCWRKKKTKKQNRKYKVEHVTYLCIWETYVDILILFVQRMFCNGEGEKRFMATHSKIGESQYFFLFGFFFSAYCNCPCLSIQRGGYACVSFWDVKGKTVAVLQKKDLWFRPLVSKSIILTLYAAGMSGLSRELRGYVSSQALIQSSCQ